MIRATILAALSGIVFCACLSIPAYAVEPRIVNIYNFIRDNDFRVRNSEAVLYEATAQQIKLVTQARLPATFALQYDALMDTNYQALLKKQLPADCEIAAWWETM